MPQPVGTRPVNNRAKLLGFPKSYAFVIGINHYPLINADLVSAVPDAKEVARMLKYRQGFDHVELLLGVDPAGSVAKDGQGLDEIQLSLDASGRTLRDLLARIRDPELEPKIQPDDCLVFYYAGHGKAGEFDQGPAGYLLPSDARPEKALLENDSLLPMEEVFDTLRALNCHHTLLILDCCFAGKFRYVGQKTRDVVEPFFMPMYEERFERFKRERAWQVLVSAGPHQTAADWMGDRSEAGTGVHSPFAQALIEALEGKAEVKPVGKNLGDGVLTSQELFLYLWNKVENLTKENPSFHIQYPDLFPMGEHRGGQFIFFDPDNKLNFAGRVRRNPYKGLQSFEAADNDLFFGRKAVVEEMRQKIRETNFLLVTAPSGAGKSSVVKAGLFPAWRQSVNEQGEKAWADSELIVLRPGARPVQAYREIRDRIDQARRPFLLIDQYEELFTECADPEERKIFEGELSGLLERAGKGDLQIVLTMRSDYEWQLEASDFGRTLASFGQGLSEQGKVSPYKDKLYKFLYRLPPMGLDELREALVAPAWVEAYDFESEELINFILEEVSYAPGALPLLSFTLSELYRMTTDEDHRIFTFKKYREELGGVNGALSKRAGAVYEQLPDEAHRRMMKKILLRMVRLNDGSYARRRVFLRHAGPVPLNELDYPSEADDRTVREVLKRLEEAHLIVRGRDSQGQPYVEPVHDSLINFWPQCRQWIDDFGRDNLLLQRQLWQAVLDSKQPKDRKLFAAYGAEEADNLKVDKDFTAEFSKLWETNPKLLEVIGQVAAAGKPYLLAEKDAIFEAAQPHIDPKDLDYFRDFLADCWKKDEMPDLNSLILSGYSDELLRIFLANGEHWLNEEESAFILESWKKRIQDIISLKQQRDEAIEAREQAEERQREIEKLLHQMALRNLAFKSKYQEQARKDFYVIDQGYKPDLYLILAGIDQYKEPIPKLAGCVNDVQAVAAAFQTQEGKLYQKVHTHLLTDEMATKENLLNRVEEVRKAAGLFDYVVVYFSGHGSVLDNGNDGSFVVYNENGRDELPGRVFCPELMRFRSKVVLILDIVGGGEFLNSLIEANQSEDLDRLTHNVFGLSGASPGEMATELLIDGEFRGAFSFALTNSFTTGEADLDGNGVLYLDELLRYTSGIVRSKAPDRQNVYAVVPATMTNIPLIQLSDHFALPKREIALSGHIEEDKVIEGIMTLFPELAAEFNPDGNTTDLDYEQALAQLPHKTLKISNHGPTHYR